MTRKTVIGILAAALLGGAGTWYAVYESSHWYPVTTLDVTSFEQLKEEFNTAAGQVRVIALLSPT